MTVAIRPALGSSALAAVTKELRDLAALPAWLRAAVDPERVGAALTARVPELTAGALVLTGCRATRPRLQQGRWTVGYRVTVARPGGVTETVTLVGELFPPPRTAAPAWHAATGAFGSPAWRCQLSELGIDLSTQPPDSALPALEQLTDLEQVRPLLEAAIGTGILRARPEVVRYHPGSRCTIRYRLDYLADASGASGHGWPDLVVAKTYRDDLGLRAYLGMCALWRSPLSCGAVVRIAEPLAYVPRLRVLVQGPVPEEQTLATRIQTAVAAGAAGTLEAGMRQAAAALAAVHRSGVGYGPRVTLAGELDKVRAEVGELAAVVPLVSRAANPLLDWIHQLDAAHPADPAVPTHGSFRPTQLLLWKGGMGLVDFDGLCQAEPALDVALFRATTLHTDVARRRRGDPTTHQTADRSADLRWAADVFTQHYQELMPVSPRRIALWEALHLFTHVLRCWTKIRPHRLDASLTLLERHLAALERDA